MSKTVAGVIVAIVALGALGGIYAANKQDKEPSSSESTQPVSDHENMASQQSNQSEQPVSDEVFSGTVEMDIKEFAYTKAHIHVKKGTIVKWTNQDTTKHDVTPDSNSPDFQKGPLLSKGESYTVTFNTLGEFSYHCSPHPFMKGTIEVVE